MPQPTLDQVAPSGLPVDHSVEAHIEAERAALAAERRARIAAPVDERWKLIRSVGLGLALAGTIAIGWHNTRPEPAPEPKFCTTEAIVGADEALRRDPDQGCAWVDADGNPVPIDAEGRPTGT